MKASLKLIYALVLLVSTGALAFFAPRGIETDLFAAVGPKSGAFLLRSLNRHAGSQIRVLCLDPELLPELRAAFPFDPPFDPTNLYETVRMKGRGLLTAKSRALLEKDELDRIRRSVKRRDYTGVGLFSKEDDPHYFLNDFVLALKALKPNLPDGAEILTGTVPTQKGTQKGTLPLMKLIDLGCAHPDRIYLSGTPFHTCLAIEKTKREVSILGLISFIGVFFFGYLIFRSIRFLVPMGLNLAAGFLVASAAVFALPERPHALTFLFGTSLIGLGVDYCYHAIKRGTDPVFVRKLTLALVSTVATFLPLLFLGVGVLTQMAIFTIVGLVVIYWGVLAWAER